jgi:endonuclease YncB( thermonuclease family)
MFGQQGFGSRQRPLPALAPMLLGLALAFAVPCAAQEPVEGSVCLVDGHTLLVGGTREAGRCHGGIKVRLFGIDAPDPAQRCVTATGTPYSCGISALNALEDLTWRRTLRCEPMAIPAAGRSVPAICIAAEQNLNAAMVRQGWAIADRRDGDDYLAEQEEARAAMRGLWAGRFDVPWQWRQERRP